MLTVKNWRNVVVGLVVLAVGIGYLTEGKSGLPPPQATPAAVVIPYYAPPAAMDFCGEPAPLNTQDARERFDREFTIVVYSHAQVYLWLKRMERYFPWLEKKLAAEQLPDDLKYVAVAESDLMVSAASPAGAAGPWQFMRATGSNYGLDQSNDLDERLDFEMATESAFRYMRDLQGLFQNWALAVAAYNCGEKRVQDEMKKQKMSSYYSLKLPSETERYIFRILAIKEVLGHPERYGYLLPKGAGYPPLRTDRVSVNLPYPMPIQVLAETAGVSYRDFKVLNPCFVSHYIPAGSRNMKVPEGKGKECETRLDAVKNSYKPAIVHHKVEKGETLSGIASRYRVSEEQLRAWNRIQGNKVRTGQSLKIVTREDR
jgi:membrane-bound lytic murein transglycosylase D